VLDTPFRELAMNEAGNRAKEPVSAVLAGPSGHPFHPMLVTVPIGAWVCSAVFDVASHLTDQPAGLATGARWLIAIGVVTAVAAACVGFLDFFLIPSRTPVHRVAVVHMALNLTITVAFALDFAWRLGAGGKATAAGPLTLSLVSLAALGISGSLGGRLAFQYGVRVAAEPVQAQGFLAVEGGPPRAASPTSPHEGGQ
jgi:uncharacterized membrane protein